MEKRYHPQEVEAKWSRYWENGDYTNPRWRENGKPFSMVMPPPNVTGVLHMGHALNHTIQDILARYHRMCGEQVLWVPGIDHAGIATQNVVERDLAEQGLDRQQIGREAFVERVWKWKQTYGDRIVNQLRRLGVSCHWPHLAFTMDATRCRAVNHVFVQLYREEYIYRGYYIINWCPRCQTALSDIEVEHTDTEGMLYYIRYYLKDAHSSGPQFITVATTRPETMLGDTAVAVHPDDPRFTSLVGRTLLLPLVDREIPLIADDYVDPEFGAGALKVTPAHDPNDFAIGRRHELDSVNVFNPDASVNQKGGPYAGMNRYEARKRVVEDLQAQGYLERSEPHAMRVGRCYRCNTEVEPYLSRQWFVRMQDLAESAMDAVRRDEVSIVPSYWERSYFNWLESIHDWCISRQIWWGHRLPVWYCEDCHETMVAAEAPTRCSRCNSSRLVQDEDVLDTWFSSSLWPFTTLGWPETTPELRTYYPTSVLCSGWDILFFWVARMIMMGLKFTGQTPFGTVCIHPLIADAKGEKMSKSRGNVIDPLVMMDKYGTDAFRFSLVALKTETPYLRFSRDRVAGYRNFANKVWNASRFAVMNLEGFAPPEASARPVSDELADRWVLSRFQHIAAEVSHHLEQFAFPQAAGTLYHFIWDEFCDWYIELVKPRLLNQSEPVTRQEAQYVLWYVLNGWLRLLHPFMPFITEEIYHLLPGHEDTISLAPWPHPAAYKDEAAERDMRLLIEVIREGRTLRSETLIPPQARVSLLVRTPDPVTQQVLERHRGYIESLTGTAALTIGPNVAKPRRCASALAGALELFLPLEGLIDVDKERGRLGKHLAELEQQLKRSTGKLASSQFVDRAPAEIVQKEKDRHQELTRQTEKLRRRLEELA